MARACSLLALIAASCLLIPPLLLASLARAQSYQVGKSNLDEDQVFSGVKEAEEMAGERVDKLVSPSGDLYNWRPRIQDWYQVVLEKIRQQQQQQRTNSDNELALDELMMLCSDDKGQLVPSRLNGACSSSAFTDPRLAAPNFGKRQIASGQFADSDEISAGQLAQQEPVKNYRALVNDFKASFSHMAANPMRQARAFKPKLMSTARGFGKRTPGNQRIISYADMVAAAGPSSPLAMNGKMNGRAVSSKYSEWIDQVMSRWPTMSKYVSDKLVDYNG